MRYEKPALASSTIEMRDLLAVTSVDHLQALDRTAVAAAETERAG